MAGISLSGLASGINTNDLITQILSAESTGRTRLAQQQTKAETRVTALQGIQSKLTALKTATTALGSVTNWTPTQTVSSSDTNVVTATRTGGAGAGTANVNVVSLASSTQRIYSYTPPPTNETLTFGGTSVTVAAGSTIDDVVSQINGEGGEVIAVNAAGRLVISSTTTGVASTFSWSSGGGALAMESEKLGGDATFTIDGGPIQSSSTNTAVGALPGVDLQLSKIGSASVTIGAPGPDNDALTGKVKAFVEAYNAVVEATKSATTEKPVKDAASTADLKKGVLFGDQGLVRIASQLRGAVGADVPGLAGALNSLAAIGVTTGVSSGSASSADSLSGKLVFDEAKFKTALKDNPASVRELLGAKVGTDGFTQQFSTVLAPMTEIGSGISDRITQAGSEVSRLKGSLTKFDERLERRGDQLRRQFAVMESALAAAQEQQSRIGAQLSSLLGSS